MRINEILTESQNLEEGPILNKIGSAVGKVAGGVAKGVGALAGGIAGLGAAAKKGFAAGKSTVAGADDEEPAADNTTNAQAAPAPAAGGAPAAQPAVQAAPAEKTKPAAGGAPAKTGSTFSKLATAAAGGAPTAPADPAAGGTQYAQVKANLDKLDKKGKQRILALLQKEIGTAPAKPAADPGANAMGQMAGQLAKGGAEKPNTMANTPVSKTNAAPKGNYDGNTGAPLSDKAKADAAFDASPEGQAQQAKVDAMGTKPAPKKRAPKKKAAAPSQAEIDADRERIMGVTSDSIIRTRPMMAESFSLFRKK